MYKSYFTKYSAIANIRFLQKRDVLHFFKKVPPKVAVLFDPSTEYQVPSTGTAVLKYRAHLWVSDNAPPFPPPKTILPIQNLN